jgi:hypothetical protein
MLLATVACVLTRPRPAGQSRWLVSPRRAARGPMKRTRWPRKAEVLEAQVRHWQQLAAAEGAAVPLVITVSAPLGGGGDQVAQRPPGS